MALDTFIAGRYSATYQSNTVGPVNSDVGITKEGYKIELQTSLEVVSESDAYGATPIDGVYRGGQCMCDFTSLAYKTGSLAAFWPWGNTSTGPGALGTLVNSTTLPIGVLATAIARTFIMTAVAGTPAAATPATLTTTQALLREGFPGSLLFHSKLREVPISLRFWPYDAGAGVVKFFATT